MKKGILLVNLGTPDSPSTGDVRRYLREFLTDGRVIDIPSLKRFLLVNLIIAPFRAPRSAASYREIWDPEKGSPLLYYSIRQQELLQEKLGDDYHIELAMRYQNPSIASALEKLRQVPVGSIHVIPLFPQYASASTGSVHQKVMEIVSRWQIVPDISFLNSFHDHDGMIRVFAQNGRKYQPETYDHILFSFHGLPERQIIKANAAWKGEGTNPFDYTVQCRETAGLIAEKLSLSRKKYTVCFQSRLGKSPWVQPYTSEVITSLAGQGAKRLLVFCPAFVADCLETIYEVSEEYNEDFRALGGEKVQLVESLNDNPAWIDSLAELVKQRYEVSRPPGSW